MVVRFTRRNILPVCIALLAAVLIVGCSVSPIDSIPDAEGGAELSLSFVIPDYGVLSGRDASASIIDARSETIQLFLNNELYREIALDGFGSITTHDYGLEWSGTFTVPVPLNNRYDSVKLQFVGATGTALTWGQELDVDVFQGEATSLSIGCLPVTWDTLSESNGDPVTLNGSIAKYQTRYFRFSTVPQRTYRLRATGGDADIFLFDADGRFDRGATNIGTTEILQMISGPDENATYFVGLYGLSNFSYSFTFEEYNQKPIANAGADQTGTADDTYTFDGGLSFDPEGAALSYTWEVYDQSSPDTPIETDTTSGEIFSTTFGAGTYDVVLTVFDGEEYNDMVNTTAIDRATATVYVDQGTIAPVAVASSDVDTVRVLDTVSFTGADSYDLNGDSLLFSWDFGDGTTPTTASSTATATHAYTAVGVYTVTLTVTEDIVDSPLSRTAELTITVTGNETPVADAGPDQFAGIDVSVDFDASGTTDRDDAFADLLFSWDFGDGTTPTTASSTPTATHSYAAAGVYTATVTVTDPKGATATDSMIVTVREAFTLNLDFQYADTGITPFDDGNSIKLALVDDYSWDVVAMIEVFDVGSHMINTDDLWPTYAADRGYLLFIIHGETRPPEEYTPRHIAEIFDNPRHYVGMYYPPAIDGNNVLYDIDTIDSIDLTTAHVVPGNAYSFSFRDVSGDLSVIVQ